MIQPWFILKYHCARLAGAWAGNTFHGFSCNPPPEEGLQEVNKNSEEI